MTTHLVCETCDWFKVYKYPSEVFEVEDAYCCKDPQVVQKFRTSFCSHHSAIPGSKRRVTRDQYRDEVARVSRPTCHTVEMPCAEGYGEL